MLASLNVIFIGDSGLFLNLADLSMHLDDRVLSKEDLFTHYIDLCLNILVSADGVIQVNFLVG
jgi:hypothetical protein